jgi:PAS domain S-box-containing protein
MYCPPEITIFLLQFVMVDSFLIAQPLEIFLSPANSFAGWVILFPTWVALLNLLLFFAVVLFALFLHKQVKKKTSELKFRSGILQSANRMLEELLEERKKNENILRESEQRWQFALEGAGDGVWDWDVPTGKVFFSDRWKSMLGYSSEEIEDNINEWDRLVHPDDKKSCYDALDNHFTGKVPVYIKEHRMRAKDGSWKWILDRGKIIEHTSDGKPKRVIGTHTDITRLKETEARLLNQNVFINTILDNLPIGVAVNSFDSGIASYMNAKFAEIYGWSKEELTDIESFFKRVYPDEAYREQLQKRIMNDIKSGDPARMKWDDIVITTSAGEKKIISAVNIPLIEQNVMVSTVQDVTGQKKAERQILKLNTQLENKVFERTRELENANLELEAFSYTVSHDLRAPLRAINGFTQILAEEYAKVLDVEGLRQLEIISDNARNMDKLIKDLLEFSRTGRAEIKKSLVNMQNLVQSVWGEITSDIKYERIGITITEMPDANVDSNLIKQVWTNLISNAVKFSGTKDNPEITLGGHVENGDHIYYVKDNGVGFEPESSERIFQVFQRLHKAGEFDGTGVGLAIVQRIVQKHGGRVWAEGKPSKGACFYFSLPPK